MKTRLIEVMQLTKVYQNNGSQVHALQGVDLIINKGEMVAVMGPSGCGKSTLLHLIGGLDSPTSGEVHINGQRIDTMTEAQRAVLRRREVGFMFQAFNLIGNLNVGDNIELPALIAGQSARQSHHRLEDLLENLGLSDKSRNIPAQLSGGEKQRVALARALVNQPVILLADEPTGNLDSKTALEVLRLLRQTHLNGQTILIVTHDPNVASLAQRVVFMKDGRIINETVLQERDGTKTLLAELLDMGGG